LDSDRDRAVFLGCILCLGPLLHLGFLMVLSYRTSPAYYLSLMGFLAVAIDSAWERIVGNWFPDRFARLAGCLVLAACSALPAWKAAGQRRTNVDLSAAVLEQRAAEGDLILVTNWAPGITFSRYYHGSAPWITLPDVPDHTLHRYDLVALRMAESDPLHDELQRLSDTLESGHRVWVLGHLPLHLVSAPELLPAAPHAPTGWQEDAYSRQWQAQAGFFLQIHAAQIEAVLPPLSMALCENYENLPLFVASGWR
jgi:hypothetical protein